MSPATSSWPTTPPRTAGEAVDMLLGLYAERGDSRYDEAVTQTEHAAQTAMLAQAEQAGDALVVAALLHDIGHLIVDEHAGRAGFLAEDQEHERIGAALLGRWFPPEVTGPIALHVPAKRYLVATDPDYAATLSAASTRSLAVQGGPMSPAEVTTFSRHRHADAACRLRRWDDRAKIADLVSPLPERYRSVVERMVRIRAGLG